MRLVRLAFAVRHAVTWRWQFCRHELRLRFDEYLRNRD